MPKYLNSSTLCTFVPYNLIDGGLVSPGPKVMYFVFALENSSLYSLAQFSSSSFTSDGISYCQIIGVSDKRGGLRKGLLIE